LPILHEHKNISVQEKIETRLPLPQQRAEFLGLLVWKVLLLFQWHAYRSL
jgi:hypothetical protein